MQGMQFFPHCKIGFSIRFTHVFIILFLFGLGGYFRPLRSYFVTLNLVKLLLICCCDIKQLASFFNPRKVKLKHIYDPDESIYMVRPDWIRTRSLFSHQFSIERKVLILLIFIVTADSFLSFSGKGTKISTYG